jgi:transcription antitermination factor NusG
MQTTDSVMEDCLNFPHWYALYTRPRFEKKVDFTLRKKGLESYLPLQTIFRQWSDRRKKIEEPLFSGYVFVRIPLRDRIFAVQTDGVVRMVSFNGTPSPIPDAEINAIKNILERADCFETTQYLAIGNRVEVIRGPFKGVRGLLSEHRGRKRLLIGIEQIRQAISVEVSEADVHPLREKEIKAHGHDNNASREHRLACF